MTLEEFRRTLKNETPEATWSIFLQALWYDGKEDWEQAHSLIQDVNSPEASHIHAYLHRKEGDAGNAAYWYHRAGKPVPRGTLSDEWNELVKIHVDR